MKPAEQTVSSEDVALNPQFRASERALLHALLQATDYGILLSGLDRQDILANQRLGELFGVAPQDIVQADPEVVRALAMARVRDPQSFNELLHQTYADPTITYQDEIELAGEPSRILRRYTGPVRDRNGEPIGRLWTFLDITETKRLQAEVQAQLTARTQDYATTSEVLRAMNALCRVAVQHRAADDLLIAILEIVRSLIGNECAVALLLSKNGAELEGIGCSPGRPATVLSMVRRRDPALDKALDTAFPTEPPLTLYEDYRGPIARRLRCRTVGVAPLYSDGHAIGALVLGSGDAQSGLAALARYRSAHLRAIVDQVALTLETHRLQSELHTAMETLQAAQRSLVEMEKLRTAGTLAASVAHDIRNILTAMQMELETQSDPVSESISAQLNRFFALTHRLLAFSRPTVLETYPTAVADVLRRIVPLVAGQAQVNSVEIILDVSDRLPLVAADVSQLEHLFVNLCLNAIQAMMEQGGTLALTGRARKSWLEVAVVDTGRGIAPEAMDRIFDPFFTTRANGLGLGLFSCKRIVEQHGGQLTVTSAPGQGACFTVMLPTLPQSKPGNGVRPIDHLT
ncbi:MAG TPA: ATP-binding protein [Chthonomonadaceae bacterium]|nr:ATP-binding protein [Chthonomonadaceae bacterium]